MFIKYMEWLSIQNNLKIPHVGYVLSNTDPKKLGRLKIRVPGLLEGNTADLPWIYPIHSYFLGGKSDLANFAIPENDSELEVIFPYDDIYFGFYRGHWDNSTIHNTLLDEDYPNQYGFKDSTGLYAKYNKTQKDFKFYHPSGDLIHIYENGDIEITGKRQYRSTIDDDIIIVGKKNANVTIDKDITVTDKGNISVTDKGNTSVNVDGTIDVSGKSSITIKADGSISITAPSATINIGSVLAQGTSGVADYTILGNIRISGDLTVGGNITAAENITAGGDVIDGGSNTNHHSHTG